MVNFGPQAAVIVSLVWGTPANFNRFRVLAALLHGTLVVGIRQTLRRWTEGATYIRQGGHHVVHWPTFLVIWELLQASQIKLMLLTSSFDDWNFTMSRYRLQCRVSVQPTANHYQLSSYTATRGGQKVLSLTYLNKREMTENTIIFQHNHRLFQCTAYSDLEVFRCL